MHNTCRACDPNLILSSMINKKTMNEEGEPDNRTKFNSLTPVEDMLFLIKALALALNKLLTFISFCPLSTFAHY